MKVTGIDAAYYTVKNIEASTKFYTDLIGKEPDTTWEGRLSEWTLDDGNAFGLYASQKEAPGGKSGMVMFAVHDVGEAVKKAQSRGVHFHDGGEVTDGPACHMAFGEDAEGNQFILHRRR